MQTWSYWKSPLDLTARIGIFSDFKIIITDFKLDTIKALFALGLNEGSVMAEKSDSNKKIKVTLRVKSNERVTIPPLVEMLLEQAAPGNDTETTTTTITAANHPHGSDTGIDMDDDM